ncbi:histidine kinase [Paenalkalicoccus suaedae]|uniref:histidine kinase n=1 Tax=Paenalkalicoccus suaedae TaxID=2592382 RepID=A0A859FHQ9_9BACI|nr:LytS/YhcK type 5TM receptor domain-containing protein [Paenalkalicoccus suaedae]QKS72657.1 histidine kinase [Paenalkalicoccus suaedae]
MWMLLLTMIERVGIIVTIVFVLTRLPFFREMMDRHELDRRQRFTAIVFFGCFGIIGTYTGLSLSTESLEFNRWASGLASDEAIANSRVIGVVIAGLLGGYKVGLGAGLIAGVHRFTLGGFTGFSCGLATIIAGLFAGYFYKKKKLVSVKTALLVGMIAEAMQMAIIIAVARPLESAIALVQMIGVPMIIANGLGCALVLLIIKSVANEQDRVGALQAQKTLRIADQTLPYLRNGLDRVSAAAVAQIIHREINASAVSLTNRTEILAHSGLGADHHLPGSDIQTQSTKNVIAKGELALIEKESISCREASCPLEAVIIAPLTQRGGTIGTLKFYFRTEKDITGVITELIRGLSLMMSTQLEIADADKARKLAQEAEIKALQTQISPHFMFNTLNTISSLIRIKPALARKTLISLSHYLRQNMSAATARTTTLEQELRHVQAYLSIEETRFDGRLEVLYEIDPAANLTLLPPLSLQPLVENAIKHGFKERDANCVIRVMVWRVGQEVSIHVADNGTGMDSERLAQIGSRLVESDSGAGLALYNVNRRLTMMFGETASLQIKSEKGQGTEIAFTVPAEEGELAHEHVY